MQLHTCLCVFLHEHVFCMCMTRMPHTCDCELVADLCVAGFCIYSIIINHHVCSCTYIHSNIPLFFSQNLCRFVHLYLEQHIHHHYQCGYYLNDQKVQPQPVQICTDDQNGYLEQHTHCLVINERESCNSSCVAVEQNSVQWKVQLDEELTHQLYYDLKQNTVGELYNYQYVEQNSVHQDYCDVELTHCDVEQNIELQ